MYLTKIPWKLQPFISKEKAYFNVVQDFYEVFNNVARFFNNLFKDTAFHRSPEVRKNFIHNLPAMIPLFEAKDQLRQIYAKLFKDPCKEVKVKCVVCFLEVTMRTNSSNSISTGL